MFHVGQLVVCVDDTKRWRHTDSGAMVKSGGYGDEVFPTKGIVYTIRDAGIIRPSFLDAYVRLVEIRNQVRAYGTCGAFEPCFMAERFRPVNPKRIEVFTSLLVTPPKVPA